MDPDIPQRLSRQLLDECCDAAHRLSTGAPFRVERAARSQRQKIRTELLMAETHRTYIPASGQDWALPLYDPMVRLLGGDGARRRLVEQARLQPGHRALEIGCGTGSLLLAIKRRHPHVELTGLDPDTKALDAAAQEFDNQAKVLGARQLAAFVYRPLFKKQASKAETAQQLAALLSSSGLTADQLRAKLPNYLVDAIEHVTVKNVRADFNANEHPSQ